MGFLSLLKSHKFWLAASFIIGVGVPGLDEIFPRNGVFICLFLIMVFSFSKLQFTALKNVFTLRIFVSIMLFIFVRYFILPYGTYIIGSFSPSWEAWGIGFMLVAVLPTGATTPVFSNLNGGNMPFSLLVMSIVTVLTPLYLPTILRATGGVASAMDFGDMFWKTAIVLLVPLAF